MRANRTSAKAGFGPPPTLLFITIVLGMFAAVAIPFLQRLRDRTYQRMTVDRVERVAERLRGHFDTAGAYPAVDSIEQLAEVLRRAGQAAIPTTDGWDRPLRYECWSELGGACDEFAIGSAGRDGAWETDALRELGPGAGGLGAELVYRNDTFVRDPTLPPLPLLLTVLGWVIGIGLGFGILLWLFYGVVLPVLQWIDDRR